MFSNNNLFSPLLQILTGSHARRKKGKRELRYGDVVGRDYNGVKQYGVYVGQQVIRFGKAPGGKRCVHECSLADFRRDADSFFICTFPQHYGRPTEWEQPFFSVLPPDPSRQIFEMARKVRKYHRYTPEETAARAKSRLGDTDFRTSEHFALWCKTGIAESHQWEDWRKLMDLCILH